MSEFGNSSNSSVDIPPTVIPRATYRLQLNKDFTFNAAASCIPYLNSLGVSHLYLSPIFRARPGSTHGYDVTNHGELNPEIGTRSELIDLARIAREQGMSIIIDIVPNHMAVMADENAWWLDVLENGPAAKHANYFDIDWVPTRASMRNRLLIPVLGERFGEELRNGKINVEFDAQRGSFHARYGEHRFPLDPKEYARIFEDDNGVIAVTPDEVVAHVDDRAELSSLLDDFSRLPARSDTSVEARTIRYRDKEVGKRRLARLYKRSEWIRDYLQRALARINDTQRSFESLSRLLNAQPYRLAFWKVAGDEINYRRFFDVNQLAALRVQEPEVFAATHRLVFELLREETIQGLRIDHVDGLHDPRAYLAQLRNATIEAAGCPAYTIVEKILASHERLREEWAVDGTTGYEFGATIVQWLVADTGAAALDQTYRQYVRHAESYDDIVYRSKQLIMRTSLAAEIAVLAGQLDRVAQAHPDTMDFTLFALRDALTEVIARFPVYRTYIADAEINSDDRQSIAWAVGAARKSSRASDRTIFNFIEDVLLGKPNVATNDARRDAMLNFTMKFQQVTAPVMAKAVEDTAFYRYARLIALNEVGSDPHATNLSNAALHKANAERAIRWPHSLLATSTHDTKRGEDVRYRLAVLSELPRDWRDHVTKWSRFNRGKRRLQPDAAVTSRDDEYFLLQTILGIWPVSSASIDATDLTTRLKEYALKAIRESKGVTSWIDPDRDYEAATLDFVDGLLNGPRGERVRAEFGEFAETLAFFGMLNSLSALILKCTAPGVPDFYQGSELPELVLVDPDNRRPIDYGLRAATLQEFANTNASALLASWRDGRIKLWLIATLLKLRMQYEQLFASGDYEALPILGLYSQYAFAYARNFQGQSVITIVSRWAATLMKQTSNPNVHSAPLGDCWGDTRVQINERFKEIKLFDVLSKRSIAITSDANGPVIGLRLLFTDLPVAVLHSS